MRPIVVAGLASLALACAAPSQTTSPTVAAALAPSTPATAPVTAPDPADFAAIVAAADRLPEERELDAQRKPVEFLEFCAIGRGMRVAELLAGFGYTTELLARAVGENGVVYALNNRFVRETFLEPHWTNRLATPAMRNVRRLDRELDDPFGAEIRDLDRVVMVLFYHDTVWQNVDRAAMNLAVFTALRPGGTYVIVDHSARVGRGADDVKTLHRIDEALVRSEVEAAGFRFSSTADFLRNPEDSRDWDASPRPASEAGRRGQSDRFVLAFVKP